MKQLRKEYIIGFILIFFSLSGFSQENHKYSLYPAKNNQELKSERLQLKGVITFFGHQRSVVIQNIEDINTLIRKGTNIELCKKIFQNFNLNNQIVIGLNIITDSFEEPKIINHRVYFDKVQNSLNVYIDYEYSEQFNRRQVAHPYWFKIPSISNDYKVIYHISKIPEQSVI